MSRQSEHFKNALSLHSVGPDALNKVYNAFQYDTGKDRNLMNTVIRDFDGHINGKSNVIYKRYPFNRRQQESEENIETYASALRTLAKSCNFYNCPHDQLI